MGRAVSSAIDSVNFYCEQLDYPSNGAATSLISVTSTATQTLNSADVTNTVHKGAMLFVAFTSLAATATVKFNIQAKDPVSGSYFTIRSVSVDGVTIGNAVGPSILVYPSILATVSAAYGTSDYQFNGYLPRTWRLQASITATASGGSPSVGFTVGATKLI